MYNNAYFNQQSLAERIDGQIAQLQQMKEQMKINQQPSINQTFQLAPTSRDVIRYAGSMEEVQRDMVIGDTPYFSKDMSVVWIKNIKGEIKTYELTEIVPKDDKDIKIEYLQAQIEELKKGMNKNESKFDVSEIATEPTESEKSSSISTVSKLSKKSK